MSCNGTQSHPMPVNAMPCYIMLCNVMPVNAKKNSFMVYFNIYC